LRLLRPTGAGARSRRTRVNLLVAETHAMVNKIVETRAGAEMFLTTARQKGGLRAALLESPDLELKGGAAARCLESADAADHDSWSNQSTDVPPVGTERSASPRSLRAAGDFAASGSVRGEGEELLPLQRWLAVCSGRAMP